MRRTAKEINRSFVCPYESCSKNYGSEGSLNLHIKIKHNGGNKTDREKLAINLVNAHLNGGGVHGQADSLKLAIARALVKYNAELKPALKVNGLLTRDPRMVERKKPGQKKARRRFQFVKR